MVANISVNGVRKIQCSGTARQGDDGRLRGEHVYRVWKQIHLHMLKKLGGVASLMLNIQ